jgi:adenylate cyclase
MIKRAIAINPSSAHAYGHGAVINAWAGFYEDSIAFTEKSLSLSPFDPLSVMAHAGAAGAHLKLGDYGAAIAAARNALEVYPTHRPAHFIMIAALVRDNRLEEAQNAARKILALNPNFKTSGMGGTVLGEFTDELAAAGLSVK